MCDAVLLRRLNAQAGAPASAAASSRHLSSRSFVEALTLVACKHYALPPAQGRPGTPDRHASIRAAPVTEIPLRFCNARRVLYSLPGRTRTYISVSEPLSVTETRPLRFH